MAATPCRDMIDEPRPLSSNGSCPCTNKSVEAVHGYNGSFLISDPTNLSTLGAYRIAYLLRTDESIFSHA